MPKYVYIFVTYLMLILISIQAHAFTISSGPPGASSTLTNTITQRNTSQSSNNSNITVENIIIESIDKYSLTATDGRTFPITASTQIINNHNSDIKMQIGELLFSDGNLVAITIK
jgi:hypothetical protein